VRDVARVRPISEEIMTRSALLAAPLLAISLVAQQASAHITFEAAQAPADSTYKGVLRVTHGCGTAATTAIRVRIPDGVTEVKPMPKAGWTLTVVAGAAQPAPAAADQAPTATVQEVRWGGGNLPDAFYDEFVIRLKLPNTPNTTVYFPVVQECEVGVTRWIEIPQAGQPAPPEPAPGVRLTAP
jgi:periplasmic copper chaperone A